jgi:phosphocarrier protein
VLTQQVTIVNRLGLHARAAARFVQTAAAYKCEISVIKAGNKVNGKSIMGLMMLAASQGTTLDIVTNGENEEGAMQAIVTLIAERFGEAE